MVMRAKAKAWEECFDCPHVVALHLGPAVNWSRYCLVPGCACQGFPIEEMPDEMFGDPRERPFSTKAQIAAQHDSVNHPQHYTSHPSGVECIQITEHYNFCLGNAIKYIWRSGLKQGSDDVEDLEKARFYLDREIARRKSSKAGVQAQDTREASIQGGD